MIIPFITAALDPVTYLFGALLGGGAIGALATLMKVKPEKDAVVVTAAQGALVVQTGVLKALETQLERETRAREGAEQELEKTELLVRRYLEVLRAHGIDPGP